MALTANSLPLFGIRAASLLGTYPSPVTFYGLLDNADGTATQYATGDLLITDTARGTVVQAASNAASSTLVGVLTPISARRQDANTPLTSGTAPAASLPNTKTVPATNNLQKYNTANDPECGAFYYPLLPGALFVSHVVAHSAAVGVDVRADSDVDIWDLYGNTIAKAAGAGANDVAYTNPISLRQHVLAQDGTGNIANESFRGLQYINPQLTTVVGGVFTASPGPVNAVAAAAAGTFNPLMLVTTMGTGAVMSTIWY